MTLTSTLKAEIYSKADNVYAWLGPETSSSHLVLPMLSELASERSFVRKHGSIPGGESDGSTAARVVDRSLDRFLMGDLQQLRAIDGFFNRPWFRRAWTRQEIAVASGEEPLSDVIFAFAGGTF